MINPESHLLTRKKRLFRASNKIKQKSHRLTLRNLCQLCIIIAGSAICISGYSKISIHAVNLSDFSRTAFRTCSIHFYCRISTMITIAKIKVDSFIEPHTHCSVNKGSYRFFIVTKRLTTPRRKQRGFLWWHFGSPRTPQGLWRRVLCQSIVTSRPKTIRRTAVLADAFHVSFNMRKA